MILRFIMGVMLIGSLVGCTTTQQPTAVNQLQIRMSQMERQLDERDQEVAELKYTIAEISSERARLASQIEAASIVREVGQASPSKATTSKYQQILRVPVSPQDAQTALKNAGYYMGAIDGKLGSGSQGAIKDFQRDHDLESDGIIGKKTWAQLKTYLE